jgi:hypothetical protein
MEEKLKNLFQKAKIEPVEDLNNIIWGKIVLHNKHIAHFKLISFSSVGIASLVSLVPVFKLLINSFIQSGFYEYLSLAFSKGGIFSVYWKEFAYSLAESLPTMNIIFVLVLVFIFFLSLHFVIKQIIKGQPSLVLQAMPVKI